VRAEKGSTVCVRAVRVVDRYLRERRAAVTRLGPEERVLWVLMPFAVQLLPGAHLSREQMPST
jgi:hypothetical protein